MSSPDQDSRFLNGVAIGLGVPIVLLVLLGVAGSVFVRMTGERVRAGWLMTPVVVAAQNVPANTVLTRALLVEGKVPEQIATASVVLPVNMGEVLGRRTRFDLVANEPLRWSGVEMEATAYFAKKELPVGAAFSVNNFEARTVPPAQLTPWTVRDEHVAQLAGTTVVKVVKAGAQLRISDLSPVLPVTP